MMFRAALWSIYAIVLVVLLRPMVVTAQTCAGIPVSSLTPSAFAVGYAWVGGSDYDESTSIDIYQLRGAHHFADALALRVDLSHARSERPFPSSPYEFSSDRIESGTEIAPMLVYAIADLPVCSVAGLAYARAGAASALAAAVGIGTAAEVALGREADLLPFANIRVGMQRYDSGVAHSGDLLLAGEAGSLLRFGRFYAAAGVRIDLPEGWPLLTLLPASSGSTFTVGAGVAF